MRTTTNLDPARTEEALGIIGALDALHSAATDAGLIRRFRPERPESDLKPLSFADIMAIVESTEASRRASDLIRDPVGEAVRSAIRDLGKRLYELGGLNLMQSALDEVAELDPTNRGHREAIMDRRWDGIGGWAA